MSMSLTKAPNTDAHAYSWLPHTDLLPLRSLNSATNNVIEDIFKNEFIAFFHRLNTQLEGSELQCDSLFTADAPNFAYVYKFLKEAQSQLSSYKESTVTITYRHMPSTHFLTSPYTNPKTDAQITWGFFQFITNLLQYSQQFRSLLDDKQATEEKFAAFQLLRRGKLLNK